VSSVDGYVSTINLTEFRYVAARYASPEAADAYIADLRRMGVSEYAVDSLWERVSEVKTAHTVALGDAYALAAAEAVGGTLLVGADDDYDVFEDHEVFGDLIERFRDIKG
jgi:predicted nucleic acid-binding protein